MKTLFLLLVIYLAYIVLKGFLFRGRLRYPGPPGGQGGYSDEGKPTAQGHAGPTHADAEPTVEDPVCGSFVPVSAAESLKTQDGVVYFCSPECRDRFVEAKGG